MANPIAPSSRFSYNPSGGAQLSVQPQGPIDTSADWRAAARFASFLRPQYSQSAGMQAQALAPPPPPQAPARRPADDLLNSHYKPTFGINENFGGTGGQVVMPWQPGQLFSPMNAPVATGYTYE